MAVLSVRGLRKRFGEFEAVAGLDLTVDRGQCFGLLGPNGAGKTTTLKLCLGLSQPDAGEIRLLDHPIPLEARLARQRVGVVPQFDNLDPDFTVAENLVIFGRYFGLPDATIRARIPRLLEFAGLQGREQSQIRELSGGMKRRLTLARALVNDPDVIFLDEPTTGLDPQARHLIWERLRQLAQQGKTLILTTHFMDEAERLCSRLAVMDHGRMIAEDSPRNLIDSRIEPHVVEVFGEGLDGWLAGADGVAERIERAGETVFCYSRVPQRVIDSVSVFPGLRTILRQANLEDVFIQLTGRELRD